MICTLDEHLTCSNALGSTDIGAFPYIHTPESDLVNSKPRYRTASTDDVINETLTGKPADERRATESVKNSSLHR